MKTLLGVAGASLLALVLTGCAGQPASFREEVRPYTSGAADDAARDRLGVNVCTGMRQTNVTNAAQGAAPLVRGGMSEADALSTVRVAVKWLCPDVSAKI